MIRKELKIIALILCAFLYGSSAIAQSCTALTDGDWEDPAIWSCGRVPLAGDSVFINVEDTVVITNPNLSYGDTLYIEVDGGLSFDGGKLILVDGSEVVLNDGGTISSPDNGNNDKIRIGGNTVWTTKDGNLTGPLTLNSGGINLDISFLGFNVETDERMVTINWETIESENENLYTVEKTLDNKSYKVVYSTQNPDRVENGINYYSYTYEEVESGDISFRIKGVDNGGFLYSKIIVINLENTKKELSVYPNPSNGIVNVNIELDDYATLKVYDLRGVEVFNQRINYEYNVLDLNLLSGVYTMLLQRDNVINREKLIIR